MELARLDSIVLKRIKFGDTSLIATLFSREIGKLSVIAKGARAARSKRGLASALEPLNRIEAIVYIKPSRSLQMLSAADIIDDAAKIKCDYDKLMAGLAALSAVDRLVVGVGPSEKIWKSMLLIYRRLEGCEPAEAKGIVLQFRATLLSAIGFAPIVDRCAICGKPVAAPGAVFSTSEGGLLCRDCARSGIKLDGDEIDLIERLFGMEGQEMRMAIPKDKLAKLDAIMDTHESYHT